MWGGEYGAGDDADVWGGLGEVYGLKWVAVWVEKWRWR